MFEFKIDIARLKRESAMTVRKLRSLERTLTRMSTYSQDARTAVHEGVQEQLNSGDGWAPKKDGSKATLRDTGDGARNISRKGSFKIIKLGNKVVLKGKTKLAFHHYGTKHVPQRKIFKDTRKVHARLSYLMTKRAQRIIKARMKK